MKYDGAQTDRDNPATRRLAALAGLAADDVVFLAGSTQEPEESVALQVFQQLSRDWPQLRLIIVPRHPERFDCVARMLDASGVAWQRRTLAGAAAERGTRPCSPLDTSPRAAGRRGRRAGGLVGNGPHRFCRRQPRQSWRAEHDRAGRLWGRRVVRPQHAKLPRHRCRPFASAMRPWSWPMASNFWPLSATALPTRPQPPPAVSVPRAWFASSSAPPSGPSNCCFHWSSAKRKRPMATVVPHERFQGLPQTRNRQFFSPLVELC